MMRNGVIVFDLDGTYWEKERTVPDLSLLIQLLESDFAMAVCSGNAAEHVIRVLVSPLLAVMYDQGGCNRAIPGYLVRAVESESR